MARRHETQSNLGFALLIGGERESGTARLEQAVAAFRAALLGYTRERVPLQWATSLNNLDLALSTLGARQKQSHLLKEALEAVGRAAEVYRAAGMVQYETDFADWISALKAEIAAVEER